MQNSLPSERLRGHYRWFEQPAYLAAREARVAELCSRARLDEWAQRGLFREGETYDIHAAVAAARRG